MNLSEQQRFDRAHNEYLNPEQGRTQGAPFIDPDYQYDCMREDEMWERQDACELKPSQV